MDGSAPEPRLSSEESDQLHRSVKKHKPNGSDTTSQADMLDVEQESDAAALPLSYSADRTFADAVHTPPPEWSIYTGEGEEDVLDDLGLADVLQASDVAPNPNICPIVDIPWEEYR